MTGIIVTAVGTVEIYEVKFSQHYMKYGISLVSSKHEEKVFKNSSIFPYLFKNKTYCMLISCNYYQINIDFQPLLDQTQYTSKYLGISLKVAN